MESITNETWQATLDLIPKECIVHSHEGGSPEENLKASIAISIAKLSAKYLEMKESLTYITNKFNLIGYKRHDLYDFFIGNVNLPGLKVAREIIEAHRKTISGMGPMIKIEPAADAAFDRCLISINATIDRNGKPSVSETM